MFFPNLPQCIFCLLSLLIITRVSLSPSFPLLLLLTVPSSFSCFPPLRLSLSPLFSDVTTLSLSRSPSKPLPDCPSVAPLSSSQLPSCRPCPLARHRHPVLPSRPLLPLIKTGINASSQDSSRPAGGREGRRAGRREG